METTKEVICEDKAVHSVVSESNSTDATTDNDSEGYIRSWSPSFSKHHIEEPVVHTVLDHLEDMEEVVDSLVHLEN
jgi:hypothetical protein